MPKKQTEEIEEDFDEEPEEDLDEDLNEAQEAVSDDGDY